MKRCSKCSTDYFENMLDFRLEDGAKLIDVEIAPLLPIIIGNGFICRNKIFTDLPSIFFPLIF